MFQVSKIWEGFQRKKREWIFPASKLIENVDYTKHEFIAKINSDRHTEDRPVEYFLKGPGADQKPYNLFVVDPKTGFVRITDILDREHIAQYNLRGIAKYTDGTYAEEEVPLRILVEDQNDNQPKFKFFEGSVNESSKIGTPVMQISAEDADEHGTINSKIAYSIVKQTPEGSGSMFSIDRGTGKIYVRRHTLDREGVDMDGAANGYTGTGTVQIQILDINDNPSKSHSVSIDLENTDNWLAHFVITKGNEDGLFSIETDPKTNEGILKLIKAVDYENIKELNLDVAVSNAAPFIGGKGIGAGAKPGNPSGETSVPIKITVNKLSKGLMFSDLVLPVLEDPKKSNLPKIIGSFPAVDLDTGKIAQNIRYVKAYDPGNWLAIDEKTSKVKLVKIPDRESEFVVNGIYIAKIICMIEDLPFKTATGTIALKVEDSNDHCPKLTSTYENVCSDTNVINITVFDEDIYPNQEPYKFVLIKEETRGEWEMVPVNGKTNSIALHKSLFYLKFLTYFYFLLLCCEERQKLQMKVCTCQEGDVSEACKENRHYVFSVKVGAPVLLMLATGLALIIYINTSLSYAAWDPPQEDSLLIFNYEGQGSTAGSVGCSSLESDNDLEFLNYLGPRFMTLAEICSPAKASPSPTNDEHIVKLVDMSIKSIITGNTFQPPKYLRPPPQQSTAITNIINNSVITETNNKSDALPMNTSQTLLVQQQPLYYLVEHQVPNTVILAERPAQGMYLINGPTGVEGLIFQNDNIAQGTLEQQGMIDGASIMQGGIVLDGGPSPTSPGSLTTPTIVVKRQQGRQKLKVTGLLSLTDGNPFLPNQWLELITVSVFTVFVCPPSF
uniref:Cadherin domain-containing protein n=1 Tax=Electrophorus electricus TaxID=8005 RepID=A0A4W4DNE4_ELEEL